MAFRHPVTHYKVHSISPVYAVINEYLYPNARELISTFEIPFGDIDKYTVVGPIGSGKYSLVFLGLCDSTYCAIKVLKNVPFDRIRRELFILTRLQGIRNVVHLYDVNIDPLTQTLSIVTNFVLHDSIACIAAQLTLPDIAFYLHEILDTLDRCHSRGVMHRDVKPGNVTIDHRFRRICLLDWGLADLYYPRTQYSVRVATLRWKAPELLFGYHFYDYAIDVWGAGCILAEMLFGTGFIVGATPEEVVASVTSIWGNTVVIEYCDKFGIEVQQSFRSIIAASTQSRWHALVEGMRPELADPDAIDLVMKLLTIDHTHRITARDACRHRFFTKYLQ